jgi:hypothetical protein
MRVTLVAFLLLVFGSQGIAQAQQGGAADAGQAPIMVPITPVDQPSQPIPGQPQQTQPQQQPPPQTLQPVQQQPYPQQQYPQQYQQAPPPPAYGQPGIVQVQPQPQTGQPYGTPTDQVVETRPRMGLVIGGIILFGVVYLINVFAVYIDEQNTGTGDFDPLTGEYEDGDTITELLAPVVGPLLLLSEADESSVDTLLVLDSVAQTAGLAMFVIGLVAQREVYAQGQLPERPRFALTPTIGPGRTGASLSLAF